MAGFLKAGNEVSSNIFILFLYLGVKIFVSNGLSTQDYGRQMAIRAHQGICWFEYLYFFPTKSSQFLNCYIQAPNVLRQIKEQNLDNKYFGQWMQDLAMGYLPKPYRNCDIFLSDPERKPQANFSDVVMESTEKLYPFRGYVHCTIQELEIRHGKDGVSQLRDKIGHTQHWKKVILNRENEFRQRHSSQPFKLAKQLSIQAQKWADKIATECNPRHSQGSDPDRLLKGQPTGESLAMSSALLIPVADTAMMAANGWYEEVKDYPYPGGYKGDGSDALFPKIGHFTQTVWRASQYVGYGYGSNDNCTIFKTYVVARYYPAGNMIGEFDKNVLKPK